jgi:hypothetical protein
MAEKQSKLEEIAIQQRASLVTKNTFNNADSSNNYNSKHTRALSDDETPVQGKGTGVFMDTGNGGGTYDINGNPMYPGSGRKPALASNKFDPDNTYKTPDTSKNGGVNIGG